MFRKINTTRRSVQHALAFEHLPAKKKHSQACMLSISFQSGAAGGHALLTDRRSIYI